MSVLSDKWIKKMSLEKKMIAPFVENQNRGDNISFGLSSYGYDARVSSLSALSAKSLALVMRQFPLT
jgi:dCTP deaminase